MSLRRAVSVAVLAIVAMVAGAGAAYAKPTGRIDVQGTDSGMTIVLTASDPDAPAGARPPSIDQGSIEVRVQPRSSGETRPLAIGGDVEARRTTVLADQSIMLVIDNSGSMGPADIAAARAASDQILGLPDNVTVGLVIFASRSRVVAEPTTDRSVIRTELQQLGRGGRNSPARRATRLYQAIQDAVGALPKDGARSIVLLSDGKATLADGTTADPNSGPALAAIKRSNVPVQVVGLGDQTDVRTLQSFADAVKGGGYIPAARGTDQLEQAFRQTADQVRNRVIFSVPVPKDLLGAQGKVMVSASADGTPISDVQEAFFGNPPPTPTPTQPGVNAAPAVVTQDVRFQAVSSIPVLVAALAMLFIALVVVSGTALGTVGKSPSEQTRVLRRLSVYTLSGTESRQVSTEAATTRLGDNVLARSAVDLVGKVVRRARFDTSIDSRLDAAGLPLRTAEWTLLHVGTAAGLGLLFLVLGGYRPLPAAVGLIIGVIGPWFFLSIRRSRRESAFLGRLPDTLQLLSGSLQAGYSLPQSIDAVVRESRPPISTEFNRALIETRLGMPAEEALEAIANRMSSRDFSWIVMAIKIQRQVGGNLAELLNTVAGTLRERERLRRQVKALSAEGRLSGWILSLLPIVFLVFLVMANPQYLDQLFNPLGFILIGVALVLLLVGAVWMSRIVRVEL